MNSTPAVLAAGGTGQWRARTAAALSSELLRRVRARSGWSEHRGGLPSSGRAMRIFTIGYEGATVGEFLAALQQAGVNE